MRTVVDSATCSGCGTALDERGYEVVVPGLAGSFHSFACAEDAYRRSLEAEDPAVVVHAWAGLEQPTSVG
jgi:hypothetical protein